MSRKRHLLLRGSRWYYSRAYPTGLRDEAGRDVFRISLRTNSLDEAQRSRPDAERRYWEAVDKARARGAVGQQEEPTGAVATSLAVEWYRAGVGEDEDSAEWAAHPDRVDAALASLPDELADLRRGLAQEAGGSEARKIAASVAAGAGFSQPGPDLARLIQRARIARAEVFAGRLVGNYGARPADPLFAAALTINPASLGGESSDSKPSRTLADLEQGFKAERWGDMRPASQIAFETVFRALRGTLGADRDLATLTRDDGRAYFKAMQAMPRGYGKGKRWEGVSFAAAIEAAKREGLPGIAPATVNRVYMGLAATLFGWAVREGWMAANPVAGLKVRDPVAARDKRDAFTDEQLQALFGAAPWTPADKAPRGKPIRYWLPLIALYQGMRLGEIAQLRPDSFRKVEGVDVFEVTGDLKNENARRTLPVHPALAALGLLDFVKARGGSERLFEGERAGPNGKWGDATGDWFGRHVKALGLEGRRLGVHSLRHNFQDALRRAGLHGMAVGAALSGRTGSDKVADAYGGGFSAEQLAEAIAKISYPGLILRP